MPAQAFQDYLPFTRTIIWVTFVSKFLHNIFLLWQYNWNWLMFLKNPSHSLLPHCAYSGIGKTFYTIKFSLIARLSMHVAFKFQDYIFKKKTVAQHNNAHRHTAGFSKMAIVITNCDVFSQSSDFVELSSSDFTFFDHFSTISLEFHSKLT